MKYLVKRTDSADAGLHRIFLLLEERFGLNVALDKLKETEKAIERLSEDPEMGVVPKYSILRRQGFRVLITGKDLFFYKIDKDEHTIIIYDICDQREDYLDMVRGL